jgi:hypothetical protein
MMLNYYSSRQLMDCMFDNDKNMAFNEDIVSEVMFGTFEIQLKKGTNVSASLNSSAL